MSKMKKLLIALCAVALSATVSFAATNSYTPGSGIVGSPHDMTLLDDVPDAQGRVCAYCHTPHHAEDASLSDYMPLWTKPLTQEVFMPYTSATLDAVVSLDVVDGPSRLCMSCHDGVVAYDSYYGKAGNDVLVGDFYNEYAVGTGGILMNDHPIGFNYLDVATADNEINDAATPFMGSTKGVTIADVLWDGTTFTCASCHDVHNSANTVMDAYFLYAPQADSQICRSCHAK